MKYCIMLDSPVVLSIYYVEIRECYDKLKINSIIDSKLFLETVSSLFSDKRLSKSSKIKLLEKDKNVKDDKKITLNM